MAPLLPALRLVQKDLEHLFADLERCEASLKGYRKDHSRRLDLASHVQDLGSHLYDVLAHVNLLQQRVAGRHGVLLFKGRVDY